MICDRGANTRLDPEKIDTDYVKEADYLHISGYTFIKSPQRDAGKRIIEVAMEEGLQISLNPRVLALKEARKEVESIIPSVDILFVNKQELDMLSNLRDRERAGRQLLDRGPSIVALKMGKKGCLTLTEEEKSFAEGFTKNIVDTTGAGDVFDAAFLVGLEKGWRMDKITRFANAAGALSATEMGARSALPKLSDVEKFLKT